MEPATAKDKQDCIRIIASTFGANPSINVVIGQGGNKQKKLSRLAEYAFAKAQGKKGAYLSSNRKGTALVFRSDDTRFNLKEQYYEIRFALSLPVKNIFSTLQRERFLKEHRYGKPHLYFWFLGVEKGGGKAVYELKEIVFEKALQEKLPIVLETSVWRNVLAYQRYGFEIYYEWEDKENGITVWFMKKDFY